jgi:hypothetical protein
MDPQDYIDEQLMSEQPQQIGDVVKGPWDPAALAQRLYIIRNHPELVQRGMTYDENTGDWRDLQARVIPLPRIPRR